MSNLTFVPYELPRSSDGRYILAQVDYQVLLSRRQQLGLTQQQVADRAHILLRQYQRVESGEKDLSKCTMKVGLSICAALLLDPYDFIGINDIVQPDPASIKPQQSFDANIPEEAMDAKRVGRKPIRRNLMKVYLNDPQYSIIIPTAVFEAIGKPSYVQFRMDYDKHRIALIPADARTAEAFDVSSLVYEGIAFALPGDYFTSLFRKELGWNDEPRLADAFLVHDNSGLPIMLFDAEKATITEPMQTDVAPPECCDNDDDTVLSDDEADEEEED